MQTRSRNSRNWNRRGEQPAEMALSQLMVPEPSSSGVPDADVDSFLRRSRRAGSSWFLRRSSNTQEDVEFEPEQQAKPHSDMPDYVNALFMGGGHKLGKVWLEMGLCSMMALYLSMMLSIESVTDLPPLPPPSLTDRLVLLTTIQLVQVTVCGGFCVMLVLVGGSYLTTNHVMKKHVTALVLFVDTLAGCTYMYTLLYGSPQLSTLSVSTPVMFPLRMLEWFFTTPVIITLISCHLKKSRTNYKLKRYALAANWMMIVAGFLEQLYPGMWGAIWLTISCISFVIMLNNFQKMFTSVANSSSLLYSVDRRTLRHVRMATLFVWNLFPLVRLSALVGLIDQETEEILFTVLDFSAKFVYTLSVLVVNFTSFDHAVEVRLEMAQEYLAREVNRNADRDSDHLNAMDQEYERKMLAYAEVEAWRHAREASLLNEGVPIAQVSAMLDSTLAEYVSLASGNISAYTR